jgi:hypothetical protein
MSGIIKIRKGFVVMFRDLNNESDNNRKSQSSLSTHFVSGTGLSIGFKPLILTTSKMGILILFLGKETKSPVSWILSHIARQCEAWIWM